MGLYYRFVLKLISLPPAPSLGRNIKNANQVSALVYVHFLLFGWLICGPSPRPLHSTDTRMLGRRRGCTRYASKISLGFATLSFPISCDFLHASSSVFAELLRSCFIVYLALWASVAPYSSLYSALYTSLASRSLVFTHRQLLFDLQQ